MCLQACQSAAPLMGQSCAHNGDCGRRCPLCVRCEWRTLAGCLPRWCKRPSELAGCHRVAHTSIAREVRAGAHVAWCPASRCAARTCWPVRMPQPLRRSAATRCPPQSIRCSSCCSRRVTTCQSPPCMSCSTVPTLAIAPAVPAAPLQSPRHVRVLAPRCLPPTTAALWTHLALCRRRGVVVVSVMAVRHFSCLKLHC
jgi:hypothetical protein